MANLRFFVSATIVAFLMYSATLGAAPSPETPVQTPSSSGDNDIPQEGFVISPTPALQPAPAPTLNARYYPYRQQLTFRGGQERTLDDFSTGHLALGFQYLFPKFLSPRLEVGADVHEQGRGHLHVGARWIAWEKSYFRPSLKAAIDHEVHAQDALATLLNIKNYFARTGATLEVVFANPYSLRLESELLIGLGGLSSVHTLGLSHGW